MPTYLYYDYLNLKTGTTMWHEHWWRLLFGNSLASVYESVLWPKEELVLTASRCLESPLTKSRWPREAVDPVKMRLMHLLSGWVGGQMHCISCSDTGY